MSNAPKAYTPFLIARAWPAFKWDGDFPDVAVIPMRPRPVRNLLNKVSLFGDFKRQHPDIIRYQVWSEFRLFCVSQGELANIHRNELFVELLESLDDNDPILADPSLFDFSTIFLRPANHATVTITNHGAFWTTDYSVDPITSIELRTVLVTNEHLYKALVLATPDAQLPLLLDELIRNHPTLLLEWLEKGLIIPGASAPKTLRHIVTKEQIAALLSNDDPDIRQRALILLQHVNTESAQLSPFLKRT